MNRNNWLVVVLLLLLIVAIIADVSQRAALRRAEERHFEQLAAQAVERLPSNAVPLTATAEPPTAIDPAPAAAPPAELPRSPAAATATQSSSPGIGEEGRLAMGGGALVPVPLTRSALAQAIKSSTAGDVYGMAALEAAGLMVMVEDGTQVLVLDFAGPLYSESQIRLLDGSYAGTSGWVPGEWVVR